MKKLKWKKWLATALSVSMIAGSCLVASAAGPEDYFNAKYYSSNYEDLQKTFNNDTKQLLNHYLTYGLREGRKAIPFLDLVSYRKAYNDLDKAFGDDWSAYLNHYMTHGIREGRSSFGDFDAVAYARRYPDLNEAFGLDVLALYKHWINLGEAEGRDASGPDPSPQPRVSSNTNSSNENPGVTDPGTTDPGTTDPGTTDPGTTDPGTTDPGTTDPGTTDPGDTGTTYPLPDGPEVSDIFVKPIENISDDFIRGMDASAVRVIENSGAKYYNYEGNEQDVYMTLAQSGVNYIRLRVWNDPYDENGNGYGGGNNDVPTAIELGKRASNYGMKVCVDFHYSDFWADPKRQHAPKAWEGMSVDEKCDALYDFTKTSLTEMLDAGVNVGMVQIGNEINNAMSGETSRSAVNELLKSGSQAVREISETYNKDIQIVVHYTKIEMNDQIDDLVAGLSESGVDYDIIGLSYYPFWDGTNENMQTVARLIQEKHGKKVMIAETSYCYTTEDGDGCGNSFDGIDDLVDGYPATVQGQASMIRDICAAANEVGALGLFYWEGTWIPVGPATADNSPIWEEFGSGWASSYASDYDPDDAGLYYGGCSWDNQAMFDFNGHPLASLNVFKYLKYGSTTTVAIDNIPDVYFSCNVGNNIELPEMVNVIYNDPSLNKQVPVTWDAEQIAAIDINKGGTYDITGTVEGGATVICHVEVIMDNFVLNSSFEDSDTSMWTVDVSSGNNPTDFQKNADDARTGEYSFHFWSEEAMEFSIEQEFTDLDPGTYKLTTYAQGGDVNGDASMELYAIVNGVEQKVPFMVVGYDNWQSPTIPEIVITDGTLTIGVRMKCNPKSWGSVDDFTLNKISD